MFTDVSQLKDKRIMVVGLAKTGVSLTRFLSENGAKVTVTDHKSKAELSEALDQMKDLTIDFDLGGHTPKKFLEQELIILSPGVSPYLKIFEYARNNNVKVTGEFEFSSWFIKEPTIAITGTNGKTTTTFLIYKMLKASGIDVWVGGNYGAPLVDYLRSGKKAAVLVLEVSSFQLEHCERFTPNNIVFTNLAEDHQDRYKSMEEYVTAKRRIFLNTNQATTSILNADDNAVIELARDPAVQRGRIFYFSCKKALEPQIMNIGGVVNIKKELKVRTGPEIEVFDISTVAARGQHMIENFMAALLASREHGATSEAIQKVITEFKGIPHRLEYVRRVGGVEFFNDSKATNVHSVKKALDAFGDNIILIMGGKDTGLNYEPIFDMVKRKVKSLILYGEAKERINRDIGDASETFLIGTFEEAVLISYQKSRIGDIVLMSPGCSSFDIFDSYVERGNYFKEIVKGFN
jgi:UDP-N-acetylmuramoylalanine--D-glutamate ligase